MKMGLKTEALFPHNTVLRKLLCLFSHFFRLLHVFPHNTVLRKLLAGLPYYKEDDRTFHTTLFYGNQGGGVGG